MRKNINIEVEGQELILKNKAGDYVIIPKKYRTKVQGMIKDNCHGCIDSLVETLPAMSDYAQDGTVFPSDDPITLIKPSGERVNTTTGSEFYRTHYNSKLIGKQNEDKSWNLTDEIYQGESLPEVVVTSKIQPNTFTDYKNKFNKIYPKDKFLQKKQEEHNKKFYSAPLWAQQAVGGYNDKRKQNDLNRDNEEYDNHLYSSYIDKLFNDFSFEFSDKEQEIMDKYSKTKRDKSLYKYFKEKNQDKKWQDEYLEATKDITFDTFTDQLPDIAKKYQGNPYIDKVLKLPHINKFKAGYQFFYEGRPLTAISELLKIPKFSNPLIDFTINSTQDNPTKFDIKYAEDKYLSPVRLASIKSQKIISDIGREIIASGETENSSWKYREFNLPDLTTASKAFSKKYNTDQNDFVEFIENYMVGRNKTYKETLSAYEKYLQSQQNSKTEQ